MHGAEGSAPSTWQCTNDTISPGKCTFNNFWELPANASWAGRVQFNATLTANRFVWWEEGESYESLATLDGFVPLRIGRTSAIAPHRRYHIDWIGFSAVAPPLAAFVPPAGLPTCPPSHGSAAPVEARDMAKAGEKVGASIMAKRLAALSMLTTGLS